MIQVKGTQITLNSTTRVTTVHTKRTMFFLVNIVKILVSFVVKLIFGFLLRRIKLCNFLKLFL